MKTKTKRKLKKYNVISSIPPVIDNFPIACGACSCLVSYGEERTAISGNLVCPSCFDKLTAMLGLPSVTDLIELK